MPRGLEWAACLVVYVLVLSTDVYRELMHSSREICILCVYFIQLLSWYDTDANRVFLGKYPSSIDESRNLDVSPFPNGVFKFVYARLCVATYVATYLFYYKFASSYA